MVTRCARMCHGPPLAGDLRGWLPIINAMNTRELLSTRCRHLLGALVLLIGAGCASVDPGVSRSRHVDSPDAALRDCAVWLQRLDAVVDGAGVRDGGESRVNGFPALRSNRFLASFRDEAHANNAVREAWLDAMATLDARARDAEISNLGPDAMLSLGVDTKELVVTRTMTCRAKLVGADRADPTVTPLIAAHAAVPDDYSEAKRVFGLYALTRWPFFRGVSAWQENAAQTFTQSPPRGTETRYTPAVGVSRAGIVARYAAARRDALDVPQLSTDDWNALFDAYAPEIVVETTGDHDRIGALTWAQAAAPIVDAATPAVYRRVSYTRMAGQTLAQLNYSFWFSERPRSGAFDLLGGALDGVIFRITLDRDGHPLLYDSIHACGCYHLFFPTARLAATPAPSTLVEWAFVPIAAPALIGNDRLVLRLATRSHYLTQFTTAAPAEGVPYQWRDDDVLRRLPTATGTRSVFAPDGLIRGTERGERWLFWPMGIAEPGAMRQWGRHATAFVGRRHFDDADLLALRFRLNQQ
jgi:hypothetical protein